MAASCVPSLPAKLPRTDTNCSDGEIYHIRIGKRLGLVLVLGVEVLQVVPVLDRSKCLDEQICFAPNPFERLWFETNSSSKHGTSHRLNKV